MKGLIRLFLLVATCITLLIACSQDNITEPPADNSSDLPVEVDPDVDGEDSDSEDVSDEEKDPTDGREVVFENDAFKIFTPEPNSEVEGQVIVKGLAKVYEGTVYYEFEDGHFLFETGHVTASNAAPEWGKFEITLDLSEIPSGHATLFLFEESAKDGSRQNQLAFPMEVINKEITDSTDEPTYVLENDSFKIISPAPHSEVENQVVVRGYARVYEATLQYELEDGHYILAEGFATTSGAAPEWGEFEIVIDFDFVSNNHVTVILYEESAKDGSRRNELQIPLTVNKADSGNDKPTVVLENDAFKIFSPAPHSEVTNQVVVRGLARIFEASFLYELEDGHFILAEGIATTSAGAPEWGEFEIVIDFDFVSNNSATLILYEASAKDGSRQHELYIPLTVKK